RDARRRLKTSSMRSSNERCSIALAIVDSMVEVHREILTRPEMRIRSSRFGCETRYQEAAAMLAHFHRWSVGTLTWVLLLAVTPWRAAAQELYGSVVGTVQDGSGARIPGATIEITNRETNLVLTTISNETGTYTFTNVLPGTYDVKVTLQG